MESYGVHVTPESLYLRQLADRLGWRRRAIGYDVEEESGPCTNGCRNARRTDPRSGRSSAALDGPPRDFVL